MMAVYQSNTALLTLNIPSSFNSRVHSSNPCVCTSSPLLSFPGCVCMCSPRLRWWCASLNTNSDVSVFRVPLREDSPSDFTPPPWAHRSVSPSSGLYKQHVVSLLHATLHQHLITLWFACLCLSRSLKAGLLTVMRKVLLLPLKSSSTDLITSTLTETFTSLYSQNLDLSEICLGPLEWDFMWCVCLHANAFYLNIFLSVSLAIPLTAYGPMAAAAAAAVVRGMNTEKPFFLMNAILNLNKVQI